MARHPWTSSAYWRASLNKPDPRDTIIVPCMDTTTGKTYRLYMSRKQYDTLKLGQEIKSLRPWYADDIISVLERCLLNGPDYNLST